MTYNWNIEKLEKELKDLKAFLIKMKDYKGNLEYVDDSIKNLDNAIYNYYFNCDKSEIEKGKFIDKGKYLTDEKYKEYTEVPGFIKEDLLGSFKLLKNLDDKYKSIELPKFRCSNDDLVCLAHDYVNWLPTKNKIWKEAFYKFTNPRNHQLKFRKYNDKEPNDAVTYFINYPYFRSYFLIHRKYDITDFFSLIHELSHGVIGLFGDGKDEYISEVEGWYSHSLGRKFLEENKIISNKELIQLEYDDFDIVHDFYLSFINYYYYDILRRQKKGIDPKIIRNKICSDIKDFTLDSESLKFYLSNTPICFSQYIFSYLLNLDLVELYEIDPEISFYNFDNFVTNSRIIDHYNLRKFGFTYMDDNFKALQKKIDWVNNL